MNLKEFADAIGVSPTTVSRSLSRRGSISEATRRMVQQRAQELGYTPNLHAQQLAQGRANMVALAFTGGTGLFEEVFFSQLLRGILGALQSRSYRLLLCSEGQDDLREIIRARAVAGVIAVGGSRDAELAGEMAALKTPCVVLGSAKVDGVAGVGSVVIDLRDGVRQVARYLSEMRHQRIAYIGSEASQIVLPVFREELESLRVPLRDKDVLIAGQTVEDGERAAEALLSRAKPPTAIFARTDELAVGILRAARRRGMRVPEDLSVVGHDDIPMAQLTDPPLTTVRIPCAGVGTVATKMLLELMETPAAVVESHAVQTELVVRGTVGPGPA